jgi:hypothetical protein
MKIYFVYGADEWGKIGESINLYLKYCYGIEFKGITICNKKKEKNVFAFCDNLNEDNFVVVPLFEKSASGEIIPRGLEIIKELRKKQNYKFHTIFLVLSKQDIPDYFHPEIDMNYYAEDLLGNPKFQNVNKAVFLGETIYKKTKNGKALFEDIEYNNIINLQEPDALTRLAKLIKKEIQLPPNAENLRELFYSTFVDYYECRDEKDNNVLCDSEEKTLIDAQKIYNSLNHHAPGIPGHTEGLELFLAPVPFPLQDFFDARKEVQNELKEDASKIKLLLIDNKIDKYKEDSLPTVSGALSLIEEDHKKIFNLEMLGGHQIESKECFNPEYEKFEFNRFKGQSQPNLAKVEKEYYKGFFDDKENKEKRNINTYSEFVYQKVKSAHFVLLDFFLNSKNTYLAFDFIKDIAQIKHDKKDFSTTWYFITSAVYDSVIKHSRSGLLAEYYESSVVSAGDDPTNKKRQIIFIYKLISFINSRIKNFKGLHDLIVSSEILNCEKKFCKDIICLQKHKDLFRKYLSEYDSIVKILPGKESSEEDFKATVELLDSTVNQFIWLPEADWPMIQRQTEYINSRLKRLDDFSGCEFSCGFINEEIIKRSQIY